jgi:hypothetical protein
MKNNKQETSVESLFQKLWDTPKDKLTWYAILEEHKKMWSTTGLQWDEYGNPIPLIGEINNTTGTINRWALRQGITMYIDYLDSYGTEAQVNEATDVLWDFVKYIETIDISVNDGQNIIDYNAMEEEQNDIKDRNNH